MGLARVLVVEDEPELRRAYRRALTQAGYAVGEASSCADGELALRDCRPWAAVVLDLKLGDGDGSSLLPAIRKLRPTPGVAVISGHADAEIALDLHHSGILLLPKPVKAQLLLSALASLVSNSGAPPFLESFAEAMRLSPREREVLRLAYLRRTSAEIARELGCAPATVGSHWQRIFHKCGCRSQRDVFALLAQSSHEVVLDG